METDGQEDVPLIAFVDIMAVILSLLVLVAAAASLERDVSGRKAAGSHENLRSENERIKGELLAVVAQNRQMAAELAVSLRRRLEQESALERVRGRKIIIPNELDGRVFFDSGSSTIRPEFYPILDRLGAQVRRLLASGEYNLVQIVGHTDVDPVLQSQYSDNWELGSERALSVLRYFERRGISRDQLSISSRGEFSPLVEGRDRYAKSRNRRIELVLLLQ